MRQAIAVVLICVAFGPLGLLSMLGGGMTWLGDVVQQAAHAGNQWWYYHGPFRWLRRYVTECDRKALEKMRAERREARRQLRRPR
jgi:hypothetical protein